MDFFKRSKQIQIFDHMYWIWSQVPADLAAEIISTPGY